MKYKDCVFGYATEVLGLGLFYLEYTDAIREGDGMRDLSQYCPILRMPASYPCWDEGG